MNDLKRGAALRGLSALPWEEKKKGPFYEASAKDGVFVAGD
jgi:hypothetical protein